MAVGGGGGGGGRVKQSCANDHYRGRLIAVVYRPPHLGSTSPPVVAAPKHSLATPVLLAAARVINEFSLSKRSDAICILRVPLPYWSTTRFRSTRN